MAGEGITVMTVGDPHQANTNNLADLIPGVNGTGGDDYHNLHVNKFAGSSSNYLSAFHGGTDPYLGSTVAMRFDGWRSIEDTNSNKPNYVRRPMSGTAVKPNTHAFVSVVQRNSRVVKVFNDIGSVTPTPADKSLRTGESPTTMKLFDKLTDMGPYVPYPGGPPKPPEMVSLEDQLVNQPYVLKKAEDDPEMAVDAPQASRWTDWFLQAVTEVREEKFQISDTFGETAFNAFGQRPRMLSFKGYLLNTADFNWRAEFWLNWDKFFRATKLVENDCQVWIGWDDIIVSGYPLNATAKQSAESPNIIMFQFSFLVTSYTNMSMKNIGQMQAMRRSGIGSDSQGNQVFLDRSNEFIRTADFSYGDWSSDRGQAMMGKISQIIGGNNLAFKDMTQTMGFKAVMGVLGIGLAGTVFGMAGAQQSGALGALGALAGAAAGAEGLANPMGGILFDSALRFIKGGSTMMQYISSRIHQKALQASQGMTIAAAARAPQGLQGINFWFGFVGELYRIIGVNLCSSVREPSDSVYDIGKAGAEGSAIRASFEGHQAALYNNRWMKMADHGLQMGTMQGFLSYGGYAASAAIQTSYLKSATARGSNNTEMAVMRMSNLEYSGDLGFYAAGESGVDTSGVSYGGDISWNEYGGGAVGEMQGMDFSKNYTEVANLPPQQKGDKAYWEAQAALYADPNWSHPSMSSSDAGAVDNSLVKDLMTEAEYKKQKQKEAVYAQNNQIQSADGSLVPVVDPDATEDDGTEEE